MKKIESLKLNKFKAYELKKESHNMVLGGAVTPTNTPCGADTANDDSKTKDGAGPGHDTWDKKDINPAFTSPTPAPIPVTPRAS